MLILDASVLIAFFTELKKPELLKELAKNSFKILIPNAVFEELRSDPNFQIVEEYCREGILEKLEPIPWEELRDLRLRYVGLHDGELEVIWWGNKFKEQGKIYMCVLDDDRARKKARSLELNLIGTVGVLNMMVEFNIVTEAEKKNFLAKLHSLGFRLPKDICHFEGKGAE